MYKVLLLGLLALMLAGCEINTRGHRGVPQDPHPRAGPGLKIPPGQLPPPGLCRIWFPGRPPGQQPPPGDCHRLRLELPPGAILLQGGREG
ncbi:hypothetical protein [Gallaecimonas sp. GXIMD4217]|uniref:hypothetical protein n=1 Tax=Gallaecimonas sp. GXIMD4217 TaxID=3131927 RepID=UPI00311AD5B2